MEMNALHKEAGIQEKASLYRGQVDQFMKAMKTKIAYGRTLKRLAQFLIEESEKEANLVYNLLEYLDPDQVTVINSVEPLEAHTLFVKPFDELDVVSAFISSCQFKKKPAKRRKKAGAEAGAEEAGISLSVCI